MVTAHDADLSAVGRRDLEDRIRDLEEENQDLRDRVELLEATHLAETSDLAKAHATTQRERDRLLAENARLQASVARSLHIPGWACASCGVFNGECKEPRTTCRACDAAHARSPDPRPT